MVEYLLRTDRSVPIETVVRAPESDLHIPALCDVEVTAALRRVVLAGLVGAERAGGALNDYLDLPLTRHGHQALLARVMALRSNFSAYDATYVALAERLGARLLTADAPLARAVRTHSVVPILPQ